MQNTNNLRVAGLSKALAVTVYRVTGEFPKSEGFGLTMQMRRAAVSIGSNFAEGCGRQGDRELVQFCNFAMGSASELQFQCELAIELGLGNTPALEVASKDVERVKKMLARLITSLRRQRARRRRTQPDQPTDRLTDRPTDRLTNRLTDSDAAR